MAGALLAMMPLTEDGARRGVRGARRGVRMARRTTAPANRVAGLIVRGVGWVGATGRFVGVNVAERTEESVPGWHASLGPPAVSPHSARRLEHTHASLQQISRRDDQRRARLQQCRAAATDKVLHTAGMTSSLHNLPFHADASQETSVQQRLISEIFTLVANRPNSACNFLPYACA
jgi:hypothetical protein